MRFLYLDLDPAATVWGVSMSDIIQEEPFDKSGEVSVEDGVGFVDSSDGVALALTPAVPGTGVRGENNEEICLGDPQKIALVADMLLQGPFGVVIDRLAFEAPSISKTFCDGIERDQVDLALGQGWRAAVALKLSGGHPIERAEVDRRAASLDVGAF
ncbi:MAG: hypothetical protein JO303_06305 [Caulobacteraceae bacterium]|nr:hypothetical protein [Caulobacteraceae bacterium]